MASMLSTSFSSSFLEVGLALTISGGAKSELDEDEEEEELVDVSCWDSLFSSNSRIESMSQSTLCC